MSFIKTEIDGPIATVTMNAPEARNALGSKQRGLTLRAPQKTACNFI